MSEPLQSVLLERPREVDVVAIERELSQVWEQAAAGPGGGQLSPIVRACAMNLIVVTEHKGELDEMANAVGDLTVEHPSRSFIVCADRNQDAPSLDAWVSVRCSLPNVVNELQRDQDKQVCCEQVTLIATGADAAKLPSVITSLLVADVPTVLIWKGGIDGGDEVLQSLIKIADRALIDSSEDLNPERRLLAWGSLFNGSLGDAAPGDLSWEHASSWRSLIADAFDPTEVREHLPALESVIVHYSSRSAPPHSGLSQALLLAGWLAQALRWTVARPLQRPEGDAYSGAAQCDAQPIEIRISPGTGNMEQHGQIESVSFHSSRGLDLSIQTTDSQECVRFVRRIGTDSAIETMLPVRSQTEAELLSGELEELHADMLYQNSMMSLLGLFRSTM